MTKKVVAPLGFCFCHFFVIGISSFQPHVFMRMMIGNGEIPAARGRRSLPRGRGKLVATVTAAQIHLLFWDGPAGAFFFSCAPMPNFFRNGSIDCLRPRNFSMERA